MPSPSKLGVQACRRGGSGRAPCRGSWGWSRGRRATIRPGGVDGQVLGEVVAAADVGLDGAVVAERGVEAAVGAVAGEQEVAVDGAERVAGDRRSPAGGQRDAVGDVVGAEVGDRRAAVAEVRVEAAVGSVAREGDVLAGAAGDDDPAVRLDRERAGVVGPRAEVGGDDAVRAEARVERAVGVVAGEREVAVDAAARWRSRRRRSCRRAGRRRRWPGRRWPKMSV